MSFLDEKERAYRDIKPFLQPVEPGLHVLSKQILSNIRSRKAPWAPSTAHPHHKALLRNIKKILVQFHPDALDSIMTDDFPTKFRKSRMQATVSPFPDQDEKMSYPGVYVGGFLHADGTPPTLRDIVRVTNIILNEDHLESILQEHGATIHRENPTEPRNLKRSFKKLGYCWRLILKNMGAWVKVNELAEEEEEEEEDGEEEQEEGDEFNPIIIDSGDDNEDIVLGESDEEDEEIKEEEEDEPEDEDDDYGLLCPRRLTHSRFNASFPLSAQYSGYSAAPKTRFKTHAGCTFELMATNGQTGRARTAE